MEEIVDIHIPPTSPDMLREISSIRRSDLTLVHLRQMFRQEEV